MHFWQRTSRHCMQALVAGIIFLLKNGTVLLYQHPFTCSVFITVRKAKPLVLITSALVKHIESVWVHFCCMKTTFIHACKVELCGTPLRHRKRYNSYRFGSYSGYAWTIWTMGAKSAHKSEKKSSWAVSLTEVITSHYRGTACKTWLEPSSC